MTQCLFFNVSKLGCSFQSHSIKTLRCFNLNILSKPSKQILKGRHYLKMSAIPSSCSLHEKLQTHCGSSRDKESFVLVSESNSNISAHLASCHLSKCGDISEAELILGKERVFVARQRPGLRVLFPGFIRNILASDSVCSCGKKCR